MRIGSGSARGAQPDREATAINPVTTTERILNMTLTPLTVRLIPTLSAHRDITDQGAVLRKSVTYTKCSLLGISQRKVSHAYSRTVTRFRQGVRSEEGHL